MKFANLIVAAVVTFGCTFAAVPQTAAPSSGASAAAKTSASPFLGRWDLTLQAPDREWPSWIEISEEGGQLKARLHRPLGQRTAAAEG